MVNHPHAAATRPARTPSRRAKPPLMPKHRAAKLMRPPAAVMHSPAPETASIGAVDAPLRVVDALPSSGDALSRPADASPNADDADRPVIPHPRSALPRDAFPCDADAFPIEVDAPPPTDDASLEPELASARTRPAMHDSRSGDAPAPRSQSPLSPVVRGEGPGVRSPQPPPDSSLQEITRPLHPRARPVTPSWYRILVNQASVPRRLAY